MVYQLHNISFSYTTNQVLDNICLSIDEHKFYGILGPNGCGKSTLLDLLIGHRKPRCGMIQFFGKDFSTIKASHIAKNIAIVTQNFYINFPYTTRDVVMMGRYPYIPRFCQPSENDISTVNHIMEQTGVNRFSEEILTELSGGERQRVVFTRALAQQTKVLILDEATSNLDIKHSMHLLNLVKKKVEEKKLTVLAVFQDINLAAQYCDHLIYFGKGTVVDSGTTNEMIDTNILKRVFDIDCHIRYEREYKVKQIFVGTKNENYQE